MRPCLQSFDSSYSLQGHQLLQLLPMNGLYTSAKPPNAALEQVFDFQAQEHLLCAPLLLLVGHIVIGTADSKNMQQLNEHRNSAHRLLPSFDVYEEVNKFVPLQAKLDPLRLLVHLLHPLVIFIA